MTDRAYTAFNPAALGPYLALERSGTVLTHNTSCNNNRMALALYPKTSGIWFGEFHVFGDETLSSAGISIGVANETASLDTCVGASAASYGYRSDGKLRDSNIDRATVDAITKDDVIGMLVEAGTRVVWYRNGIVQGEIALDGPHIWTIAVTVSNATMAFGTKVLMNTGQQAFAYPPPLITNQGWYDTTASFGALRVADRPALVDGTRYHGLISARQSSLVVTQSLSFPVWDDQPAQGRASLVLDNASGYADSLFAGDPRDAIVDVRDPDTGAPLMSMLVDSAQGQGDAGATIRLRDRMVETQVALQRRLIRPGADPSSAFKPWPVLYGAVYSIEPPLLDYAAQDYAVNDGAIAAVGPVRDKGDPFDFSAGDFTYETTDGTLTLHKGQAQGRVTMDASSVGGTPQTDPVDLMGGDGDFTSGTHWTLGGGAAGNSTISGGLLTLADYTWPDIGVRSNGVISWAKYNSITLTAGRTYRIVIKVRRVSDAPTYGQPGLDVPARLDVTGGGSSPSRHQIPWISAVANKVPHNGWRNYDHSSETIVGYASPKGTSPALFLVLYGSYAPGDQAVIEDIQVNEIGIDDYEDDDLTPITLEAYMRAILEVRAGWDSDRWSAADAAAIDAATGYAGLGMYASVDASLTVYDALQLAVQSYCASLWIDDAGVLRITRLFAPEDVPAALVDHHIGMEDMLDEPDPSLDVAQNLSTQLGARKNWSPLSGSDLVTDGIELPTGGNPANSSLGITGDIQFSQEGWEWKLDPDAVTGNLPATATRWPAWSEVTGKPKTWDWSKLTNIPPYTDAWGAINPVSKVDISALGSMAYIAKPANNSTTYGWKGLGWTPLGDMALVDNPSASNSYARSGSSWVSLPNFGTMAPQDDVTGSNGNYIRTKGFVNSWTAAGSMALKDDATYNSVYYARRYNSWVALGTMANVNAPASDGKQYAMKNGAFAEVVAGAGGDDPRSNMIQSPSGESGSADWTIISNVTMTPVTEDGERALRQQATTGTTICYADYRTPVTAGKTYSFQYESKKSNTDSSSQMMWLDSGGAAIGPVFDSKNTSSTSWQSWKSEGYVAPVGATQYNFRTIISSPTAGDKVWLRRMKLEEGPVCTAFTDDINKPVSTDVTNIVVTGTTPSSDATKSGTLYLVY